MAFVFHNIQMNEAKKLPNLVTYLDIIKTIAVITMIIDHIGFYFFPEVSMFRAIGRIGVPVWFFLIGYAQTRELPNRLLIGALIIAVVDFTLFQHVFAMNVLVSIILLRLTIDYVMDFITRTPYIFFIACILMVLGYFATKMVFEYGTLAYLFAMAGFMVRNRGLVHDNTFITTPIYYGFMVFVFLSFALLQNAQFNFSEFEFIMMALLSGTMMVVLVTMKPMTFPQIRDKGAQKILQFCGRKTLEIYVAHLILFKVIYFTFLALK